MKNIILAIFLVVFPAVSHATLFDDFPDLIADTFDYCESSEGCFYARRIVSEQGFFTSAGSGYSTMLPGGQVIRSPYFSVDDTGSANLSWLAVSNRLDLKGTNLFHKSEMDLSCEGTGPLNLNFWGDSYVVNAPNEGCIITGITNGREGFPVEPSHEVKLRFQGGPVILKNMAQGLPQFIGQMRLEHSQDMFFPQEFSIKFHVDGGIWWLDHFIKY